MQNIAVAGPLLPDEPAWLFILLQDSFREGEDALVMGQGMLGETGRAIVWSMCEKFHCEKLGVPWQTCRVFERYMANLFRVGIYGIGQQGLYIMDTRLMLTLACCFQIAMKTTSSSVQVGPKAIRRYLASCGIEYSIIEIMSMEREIFRGIGYRVPLYNSVEMAGLLADHLNVDRNALELIGSFVHMAESTRPVIEREVRWIAGLHRVPYSTPRVRTVHLAAGCVAAAVKTACLQASNDDVAIRLASMLRVPGSYIKVVRDALIVRVPKPPTPKPKHRPDILRRERFAAHAGHSEPQPSTSSQSTLF